MMDELLSPSLAFCFTRYICFILPFDDHIDGTTLLHTASAFGEASLSSDANTGDFLVTKRVGI